ncbi:hypothetical protein [Candidatus Nitrososphaera gargensis]|uniref:hypothetical protein n=1 Tax=Candidatus Nitrososphaera gargensis TaxID=497727 RepID=UPI0016504BAA|nr:hypothetical protein [Candidatus Nitrososphaera gargensis]
MKNYPQHKSNADTVDEKYNDIATNDFLIGLVEQHEKMAWMIRARKENNRIP